MKGLATNHTDMPAIRGRVPVSFRRQQSLSQGVHAIGAIINLLMKMINRSMYSYISGISQIDDITGGFKAGTTIPVPAPPLSYADTLACALTKPLDGEYAIIRSTSERAAEAVNALNSMTCTGPAPSRARYAGNGDAMMDPNRHYGSGERPC